MFYAALDVSLPSGWYSRVHVKSQESLYTRALLTSRKVMQRKCIDFENEIRGVLKVFGVKLPMRVSRWAFDRAVREIIVSDPGLSHALLPMLEARQVLFATFTRDGAGQGQGPPLRVRLQLQPIEHPRWLAS